MPVDHIIEAVLNDVRTMPNVKEAYCESCIWPEDTIVVVRVTFENVTEKRFGRDHSEEAKKSLEEYVQMAYPSARRVCVGVNDYGDVSEEELPSDQERYALDFADKWQFPDCNYDFQVAVGKLEKVIRGTVDANLILDKLESLMDTDVLAEALMKLRDPVADNRGEYDKAVEEVHKAYEPYALHKARKELAVRQEREFWAGLEE